MEPLIDISGYAESYDELCTKVAYEGEYYNVLDGKPFTTYRNSGKTDIGYLFQETDVLGWYQNKAELLSYVTKPNDKDVYITGMSAPYTRWKATVRGVDISWAEDGTEEKKVLKNYKAITNLGKAHLEPKEDIYYSVGKEAPYRLYGTVSSWDEVGTFISCHGKNYMELGQYCKGVGHVGCIDGLLHIRKENGWEPLEVVEPISNYSKHVYADKDRLCKIREGFVLGTLEFYVPRK